VDGVLAWDGGAVRALRGVSLRIDRGEAIGICGPTGGGKTTLTDLLIGILDPTEGRVTVDGHDLADHRAEWFRKLGVVPQMVFLVDDTLRSNIALGVPDEAVDQEALEQAIVLAQLAEFVDELPDGLDTTIGERGVRVSGGQRQRIAIARALYRRPDVLVFDEGTSALDNTTESVLISSLERLRGDRTIILVAHRLSTVRNCDWIAYVESGRVAGVGTFSELEQESGGFRALAQRE
jgi:ATP-binding cassette, subfamily B, bacterial PglK